ncbi:MAG: PAC2 family protein [Dehalococcoidia bacterium]|nr:PAC2 family protein [Dehalococcoidia bacterium]
MDGFSVSHMPELRSPVVVLAFTGWSDTGTVTVDVARRLIDAYAARAFLSVDPEEYYVFTDTRPTVRLDEEGLRQLDWPKNEAHAATLPEAAHDIVVVHGAEPNLRWRTFATRLADILADLQPSIVCTLVARPAATPHTRPIPVSGSAADPVLAERFGLGRSVYQGPTGILGVVHDALRRKGTALMSLAASIPHYLNVEENPPATMALLRALEPVIGLPPPLGDLEEEGERFLARVEEASRGDDQIGAYVRTLEEHYGESDDDLADGGPADLPSAADILRDVEDLLRGGNEPGQGG